MHPLVNKAAMMETTAMKNAFLRVMEWVLCEGSLFGDRCQCEDVGRAGCAPGMICAIVAE